MDIHNGGCSSTITTPVVVLTLHTASPEQDASFLQALFPRTVVEQVEKSSRILTIKNDGGGDNANHESETGHSNGSEGAVVAMVTLVPLLAAPGALTVSCLVVESTSYLFQQATNISAGGDDRVKGGAICGISIREIQLPAGGSILLVPPLVVASLQGRRGLALRLAGNKTACVLDSPKPFQSVELSYSEFQEEASRDGRVETKEAEAETTSKGKDAALPTGVPIPSLQASVLVQQGQWQSNIPLNTQTPIPVETDLFKGQMLLLVRPPDPANEDPFWHKRIWSIKKRRVIFQMQGKFKYQPTGVIYAGGQVTKPMKLGLITRGLSTVLLRLIESFNSKMHYSFGTTSTGAAGGSSEDDNAEMAHIVVPAYTFFERVVITPPGETPPPLTEFLEESPESLAARKRAAKVKDGVVAAQPWNTTDTFSLSFYSMYIDLPSWQLRQIPSANISLHSFWGDSLLRICMYEKQADSPKQHLQKYNKYIFAMQMKHLTAEEQEQERFITMANSEQEEDEKIPIRGDTVETEKPDSIIELNHDHPVSFVRESARPDFEDTQMKRTESGIFLFPEDDEEQYYFDAEDGDEWRRSVVRGNGEEEDRRSTERELLRGIDNACPAWIEVCSSRSNYSKAFAVIQDNRLTLLPAQDCEDLVQDSKWANRVIRESFSSRLSSTERTRRAMGLVFSAGQHTSDIAPSRIESLVVRKSKYDASFLKRPGPSNSGRERMPIRASCFVARAISDRHWIEEWATLTEGRIAFYHPDKRSSHYRIPLSSVHDASLLPPSECPPILDHYILALSTPGRTVYLLFNDEGNRNEWLKIIRKLLRWLPNQQMDNNSVSSTETNSPYSKMEMENPADEFMHKSSMWSCKNRRILNCARFSLYSGEGANRSDPLKLVETALREALKVSDESSDHSASQRRGFLVSTALLKDADVKCLSEDKKTVFFLNLYHVMILHAYLVLGPPDSSLKWISYFNNVAYQVADDIFSLTELEHCIIRSRMTYPSQFLSRFVIPKSWYRFALTRTDYRFNFALNCGSKSNPRTILIYNIDQLQDQLDEASREYLATGSVVSQRAGGGEMLVQFPRICQWFLDDFGGSNEGLLHRIEAYLPDKERLALRPCWLPRERRFDMRCVSIRFLPFQFECQPLRLRS